MAPSEKGTRGRKPVTEKPKTRNPQPERKRWPVGVGNTGGTRAGNASPPRGNTRRERRGKRHRRQASAHEKPKTKKPKPEPESAGKPFGENQAKPGRKIESRKPDRQKRPSPDGRLGQAPGNRGASEHAEIHPKRTETEAKPV